MLPRACNRSYPLTCGMLRFKFCKAPLRHTLNFSFLGCLPGCLSQSARQDLYASKIQSYLFQLGPAYPNLFSWSIQLYEPANRNTIGRVSHLLSYSNHPSIRSHVVRSEKLPIVRLNAGLNHQWYKRAKRTGCIQCRVAIAHKKRAANAPSATKIERARQTECGCTICKVCTVP